MSLSSAPFRPAPMRLPSFAELNERLSLSSGKASFYDSRDRPVLPSPSDLERPSVQSARYAGKFTALSEPSPETRDGHPYAAKTTTPSATEEGRGLTSGWLPIDDPGRSTGTSQHIRRATNPTYDQPSPQYSWSPRQQSPPWNSSPSSAGPTPVSSSSGAHARYHPFRRAPSYSPEHNHPPQMNGAQYQQSYPQSPSLHSPPLLHHQHHSHASMKNGADGLDGGSSGQGSSAIPRRRGKLPKDVTERLKTWLMEHASHPYPNEDEKRRLCMQTGLSISQVSNWFINARRRILAPQMSTSAPASAGGMSSLAERERHLQYGQPHQHHDQHYSNQSKYPYHHQQHPHVHSYAGQYASPDPRRTVTSGIVGRRGSDGLVEDRSPILTHSEDEYRRR
ncbi:hypothetical protein BCV69DRAFT_296187 [Microstroma glucosiphilum]|uniref:Homeobox domain-containing protein n=1 Tax=Pseudomicrostroma glucosiphilum TaxID=1684307 RepID=A0A316UG12_9BASI|nr:hypothetical protein BCV69DRAFT_296187 [Pseudomicrostroma glucosiphilum]PWN23878.1 hypothetical protein BCV69DRAFT_296187 [Pseudomicrostroma glucosiphilum]